MSSLGQKDTVLHASSSSCPSGCTATSFLPLLGSSVMLVAMHSCSSLSPLVHSIPPFHFPVTPEIRAESCWEQPFYGKKIQRSHEPGKQESGLGHMQEGKLILVIPLEAHHTVSVTFFFISRIASNSSSCHSYLLTETIVGHFCNNFIPLFWKTSNHMQ